MNHLVLHGYWRSSAAYRVRIALGLKGLAFQQVTHDLRSGEQRAPDYRVLAPHGLVPTLVDGETILTQSPAIIEWLEEVYPAQPLLPTDPYSRALVRAMANTVACDIHPLNNLRVLERLRHNFGADKGAVDSWAAEWICAGFHALETLVQAHGKGYCFGNIPTLADCFLIPQLYSAVRFGVELGAFPALVAVGAQAASLPAFKAAHPDLQPDADPT